MELLTRVIEGSSNPMNIAMTIRTTTAQITAMIRKISRAIIRAAAWIWMRNSMTERLDSAAHR